MTTLAQSYTDTLAGNPPPDDALPGRCWPRCSPADWRGGPDARRKNWIRTTCAKCGAFVGFRPVEGKQKPAMEAQTK